MNANMVNGFDFYYHAIIRLLTNNIHTRWKDISVCTLIRCGNSYFRLIFSPYPRYDSVQTLAECKTGRHPSAFPFPHAMNVRLLLMTRVTENMFRPPCYLRHFTVQTVLASMGLRKRGGNPMLQAARRHILDAGNGIRLLGFHSPVKNRPSRGLCILLHGWEGSSDSTYVLSCGRYLYRHGYDVFRLNYRDHGDSHHLNNGLFYATRLEEVYQAVRKAVGFAESAPVFLVGFSLGGNFALRIAKRSLENNTLPLRQVISISPVLDPDKATDRIDSSPFLLTYFMKKWKQSLRRKAVLFPDLYDFTDILNLKTIREMTDLLLNRFSGFPDTKTYFRAYGIYGEDLAGIQIPTAIITAADDPIIPVEDFKALNTAPDTDVFVHANGGHNGFVDSVLGPAWYDRFMRRRFEAYER
jgi:predicted alpha/beta-fold hydrolase